MDGLPEKRDLACGRLARCDSISDLCAHVLSQGGFATLLGEDPCTGFVKTLSVDFKEAGGESIGHNSAREGEGVLRVELVGIKRNSKAGKRLIVLLCPSKLSSVER